MNDDIISVIIPSYNYEKYIIECMQSIANQDYKSLELIVIEDCSMDNSRKVIKEYLNLKEVQDRFFNIIYLENKVNKGAHYSIIKGVMSASGKYIAIINADDLYESNRFSCIIPKMKAENRQLMFSSVDIIDSESNIAMNEEAEEFRRISKMVSNYKHVSFALMRQNVAISTGNMLFTKALYEELKGFREYKYIHDWDYILRACIIEEPGFVEDTKYYYRLHNSNSFRNLKQIADIEVNIVLSDFFSLVKKQKSNPVLNKVDVYNEVKDMYLKIHWKRANIFLKILLKIKYKRIINGK